MWRSPMPSSAVKIGTALSTVLTCSGARCFTCREIPLCHVYRCTASKRGPSFTSIINGGCYGYTSICTLGHCIVARCHVGVFGNSTRRSTLAAAAAAVAAAKASLRRGPSFTSIINGGCYDYTSICILGHRIVSRCHVGIFGNSTRRSTLAAASAAAKASSEGGAPRVTAQPGRCWKQ